MHTIEPRYCSHHPDRPAVVEVTFHDLVALELRGSSRPRPDALRYLCRDCQTAVRRAFFAIGAEEHPAGAAPRMLACGVCGRGFNPDDPQPHAITTGHQPDVVRRSTTITRLGPEAGASLVVLLIVLALVFVGGLRLSHDLAGVPLRPAVAVTTTTGTMPATVVPESAGAGPAPTTTTTTTSPAPAPLTTTPPAVSVPVGTTTTTGAPCPYQGATGQDAIRCCAAEGLSPCPPTVPT